MTGNMSVFAGYDTDMAMIPAPKIVLNIIPLYLKTIRQVTER